MVRGTGVQSQVVIPKTQKMVLDAALFNTQHNKLRIKGKNSSLPKESSDTI